MEQRRVVVIGARRVIGAPSGAGACGVDQEQTPTADWQVATVDIESGMMFSFNVARR